MGELFGESRWTARVMARVFRPRILGDWISAIRCGYHTLFSYTPLEPPQNHLPTSASTPAYFD